MKKFRSQNEIGRLNEAISYRISFAQRAYLEGIADSHRVGLGEVARLILNEAMARVGAKI